MAGCSCRRGGRWSDGCCPFGTTWTMSTGSPTTSARFAEGFRGPRSAAPVTAADDAGGPVRPATVGRRPWVSIWTFRPVSSIRCWDRPVAVRRRRGDDRRARNRRPHLNSTAATYLGDPRGVRSTRSSRPCTVSVHDGVGQRRVRIEVPEDLADDTKRRSGSARTRRHDRLFPTRPAQLSGGQRQRVALARAWRRRPCCLLDEPLWCARRELRKQLRLELRAAARGRITWCT